jgi:hypothetical protein
MSTPMFAKYEQQAQDTDCLPDDLWRNDRINEEKQAGCLFH